MTLGNDKRTSDLDKHALHEDFPKLKILAAQLDVGDITVPDDAFISIGDVRASRYACKAKDEIYGDSSYVNDMLALPPSMQEAVFTPGYRARLRLVENILISKTVIQ